MTEGELNLLVLQVESRLEAGLHLHRKAEAVNAPAPRRLPLLRAECEDGPRPCPHVTCRHHLDSPFASCSLDIADGGQVSVREVARLLGISRINVERIERGALVKALRRARINGLSSSDLHGFGGRHRQGEHMVDDADGDDMLLSHTCIACDRVFTSPRRNETQRLFCDATCRGEP